MQLDAGDMALVTIPIVESRGFPESTLCLSESWDEGRLEATGPRIYT